MTFQFNSLQEMWAMAGHGPYVWTAVLVSVAVLCWLLAKPIMQHRQALKSIARNLQRDGGQLDKEQPKKKNQSTPVSEDNK
ncbi:heme exporter protein CcmD [Porticoccaceae bacterium]|jgi:heme exporter protein CcmD|nr:heme exporter protein CcmD [Porticoccaceae bacterium]CAI8261956.1 MAG: Heme exporter protein D [SAR92 bacterium MED-G29]|tara:strand:- start:2667 stop:2909 length:243 start_codon:yes stop_codon:yes gene_type:complete